MIHKKVKFNGEIYWWHDDLICPLNHYDEDGELLANPLRDISYAVIEGDEILRYHEVIGDLSDLVEIENE